jgi:ribosome maturation factor RimP
MITQARILGLIDSLIVDNELFVVSLEISLSNKIRLLVDSLKGIQIDDCVRLSRAIEQGLDREIEDFELEVSSAGLDAPFRVKQQYDKNIGREVDVIRRDGQKIQGKLLSANENSFSIEASRSVKVEGKKKKQISKENIELAYNEVSKVKVNIIF